MNNAAPVGVPHLNALLSRHLQLRIERMQLSHPLGCVLDVVDKPSIDPGAIAARRVFEAEEGADFVQIQRSAPADEMQRFRVIFRVLSTEADGCRRDAGLCRNFAKLHAEILTLDSHAAFAVELIGSAQGRIRLTLCELVTSSATPQDYSLPSPNFASPCALARCPLSSVERELAYARVDLQIGRLLGTDSGRRAANAELPLALLAVDIDMS